MKRTYDPQIDKYHNRLEYGDKISIVVDDATAERIRKEDAAAIEKGYAEVEAQEPTSPALPVTQGMTAPIEWHEANFKFAKNAPQAKEIYTKTLQENDETGEMDEIKFSAGYRGAVASGRRLEDGSIEWDWNYEEEDVSQTNLLDIYVSPDFENLDHPKGELKVQHMEVMPTDEKTNPLMRWKNE